MRISHLGHAALRLVDDDGHSLLVDPFDPVSGDEPVLLTGGPWAERWRGALSGSPGRVAAPDGSWRGGTTYPCELGEVRVRALTYEAPDNHTQVERTRAGLRHPRTAAARLWLKRSLPEAPPVALRVVLPQDRVVVHLGLSLNRATPSGWLARARMLCEGAEVVLAGPVHGEQDAFEDLAAQIAPRRLLVTDQINDQRRDLSLPVEGITLLRDRLAARGVDAYVFVTGIRMRFEEDVTVPQWGE